MNRPGASRRPVVWRAVLAGVLFGLGCSDPGEGVLSAPAEGFVEGATEGVRLYYRVVGGGPDTLVVVHGFQGNNQNYLAPDLTEVLSQHSLVFYDQRGGGRSSGAGDGTLPELEDHVADLEALHRGLGLSQVVLLGHSGGAYVAVQYALDHPDRVERLILAAPGSPGPEYAEETNASFHSRLDAATWARLQSLHASLSEADDPASVCEEVASVLIPSVYLADSAHQRRMKGSMCAAPEEVLRTEPQRLAAFQASVRGREWAPDLRRISVPVLILAGDRDAVPVAAAEEWEAKLPHGHLVVLSGADHLPWLDRPEAFSSAVDTFLADATPRDGDAGPPGR